MNCIFCKIIARQLPAYIIAEDENTIVFVSLEGHPIVAPKEHIPDIFGLDDELGSKIMKTAREVARATKEGLAADGISHANEWSGGRTERVSLSHARLSKVE